MRKIQTKATKSNTETAREQNNRKLARTAATEGIVLLKNDGVLPIQPGRLALFGAGASMTIKGGTGSGEVNERHSVTIWEGLKNAGFTITTESWLKEYQVNCQSAKENHSRNLARKALFGSADDRINIMADSFHYPPGREITDEEIRQSGTDTCIYVIARQAGECSDRSLANHEYDLEDIEISHIKKAAESFKNTIVVINVGSSMDISQLEQITGINALIFFCQQGMEGGNAFADIITGKVSPSGCLTNTWPGKYEDIPFSMEYSYLKSNTDKEEYKEGIYVGYRYFDSFKREPRYEFGFGLSYTSFYIEYTGASLKNTQVRITTRVTNTGDKYAGKKVVQLYVSGPDGKLTREYQSLAAFGKTRELQPGESQDITMAFDMRDIAGYDEETACYLLEKGAYTLRLGESSKKTQVCAVIDLNETAVTEKCGHICPLPSDEKELLGKDSVQDDSLEEYPAGIQRISMNAAVINTIVHDYGKLKPTHNPKVEKLMESLTLNEMLKVIMGSGILGVKNKFEVPGAAATTTSVLYDKGVCNVALCDGPAGLRLQRTSVITKSGSIKSVDAMMDFMNYFPKILKLFMFGNPEKGTPIYQYTTAFPVGTAMAQTWNVDLMEQFGQAVGTEMVEYGATFWLAPGMNIQRNPLCGRNYEYYSEDPLLTGKLAAAVTRGVQSHEGCYVTIKHYAANNQETNRNRSNSIVSERTLREIYLKGYRIAVEEGGAKGVMTSYNKLNDVYTPNSYDLCTKVLRNEWGFDGVVMTDWFSTGKGLANNGKALKAGNDLIMPGGKEYEKAILQDIKDGIVSEEDIRQCCANVLNAVVNSRMQKEMDESAIN